MNLPAILALTRAATICDWCDWSTAMPPKTTFSRMDSFTRKGRAADVLKLEGPG